MKPISWIAWNPSAGYFAHATLLERVVRYLHKLSWQVRLLKTYSPEHLTALARQAADEGVEVFFVAGGDGSLNYALPGLLHSNTVLGVLPSGTANVWAQELGLSSLTWRNLDALDNAIRRLMAGRVQQVDVGICNERPFLLWSGVGLDGFVTHRIEPRQTWQKRFGMLQYASVAVMQLPTWRGVSLRGVVDDAEIAGRYILAVVGNIRLYAGGIAKLSPAAKLDDGMLELWLFEGASPVDTARHALDLWAGWHEHSLRTRHIACRSAHLRADAPLYLQLDGEPVPLSDEVNIRVLPRALQVLVPDDLPADRFVWSGQALAVRSAVDGKVGVPSGEQHDV